MYGEQILNTFCRECDLSTFGAVPKGSFPQMKTFDEASSVTINRIIIIEIV